MKTAKIIIGANYGDEGKGTVVAHYTKNAQGDVLNILTNGGSQRGHSILTEDGSMTFQHFGSGTYHGADNYYSRFFILNPMQFVKEYESLIVKPKHIFRDSSCRWSTPYDSMANIIEEQLRGRNASCGMGIWNTIKRYRDSRCTLSFDAFLDLENMYSYLHDVKKYYEQQLDIPDSWKTIWDSPFLQLHFINDCRFMQQHTCIADLQELDYDNLFFENGQGLLLCDTGKDTFDTTPSNTGIQYSLELLKGIKNVEVTAHYVTRPYLTRHGDGVIINEQNKRFLSSSVQEDRTNHFNEFQGEFRYGHLDIAELKKRITKDCENIKTEIDVTHCDEMDRISDFKKNFHVVNTYDSAFIK